MRIYNWKQEGNFYSRANNSIARFGLAVEIFQANFDLAGFSRLDFIFGGPPAVCKTPGLADILRPFAAIIGKTRLVICTARTAAPYSVASTSPSVKYKCKSTSTRIRIKRLAACRYRCKKGSSDLRFFVIKFQK